MTEKRYVFLRMVEAYAKSGVYVGINGPYKVLNYATQYDLPPDADVIEAAIDFVRYAVIHYGLADTTVWEPKEFIYQWENFQAEPLRPWQSV